MKKAVADAQPLGLGALLVRHVDADHPAGGADLQRRDERIHPGPAAEIDDDLASFEFGQVEIIADAGKRFDRLGGNAVEIGERVAEPLGQRAAHFEMEFSVRLFGDAAVHRLHLGFEFLRIESNGGGHDVVLGFVLVCACMARRNRTWT